VLAGTLNFTRSSWARWSSHNKTHERICFCRNGDGATVEAETMPHEATPFETTPPEPTLPGENEVVPNGSVANVPDSKLAEETAASPEPGLPEGVSTPGTSLPEVTTAPGAEDATSGDATVPGEKVALSNGLVEESASEVPPTFASDDSTADSSVMAIIFV